MACHIIGKLDPPMHHGIISLLRIQTCQLSKLMSRIYLLYVYISIYIPVCSTLSEEEKKPRSRYVKRTK
jgi:hypothetical protein